jgi:hypothetical protein
LGAALILWITWLGVRSLEATLGGNCNAKYMWRICEHHAEGLLMNLRRGIRCGKTSGFSEGTQENPPHSTRQKSKQVFVFCTFPPIHSAHHNKKKQIYFLKRLL